MLRLVVLSVVLAVIAAQDQCSSVPLTARQDCGDVHTTPDSCVAKGCCWNVTTVANEPNCYHKIIVDAQCNVDLNARRDCGDVSTTPTSCTAKGCCWMVSPQPGHPNCFYKGDGPGPTQGPDPTRGPSPGGKKVYIHMMPWFETKDTNGGKWGQHWTMANKNPDQMVNGRRDIASHYYPLIGPYASGDTRVIDWQLGLMKLSGVTGVLIDWPGTARVWDYPSNLRNCEAIIAGTQRHGLEFAIVYEDHNLGMAHDAGMIGDIIAQGKADMAYIQSNYFTKSNYIRINGAPLLLDFGPQTLTSGSQWDQIFSVFNQKPTFLTLWNQMQQAGNSAKGEFAWIYNNFIDGLNNFYKYRNINVKFGVAYPGFNSYYNQGGWPGPGWTIAVSASTFEQTLNLALANTDNVQVVTWNDYGEGTIIEPTQEFHYDFLTILQRKMGVAHNQADLEKLTNIYNGRVLYHGNATMMAQLEKEHYDLVNKAI